MLNWQQNQNQASQFRMNSDNGIEISDFKIDNNNDNELDILLPFLKFMSGVKDVRPVREFMSDFYGCREICYLDVNGMNSVFQRGRVLNDDRLETEKTESKIEQIDMLHLCDDEKSQAGQTIRLENPDNKKSEKNMMGHFEDDIDVAMNFQDNINNSRSTITSPKELKVITKNNNRLNQKMTSVSEKKQTYKQVHKNAKTAFDFNQFKSSIYNKIISPAEKENVQHHSIHPQQQILFCDNKYNKINEITDDQSIQCISKSMLDTNQSQNADINQLQISETNQSHNVENSDLFIQRPTFYTKPHQRRCASQAIRFAEITLKDENFNSPMPKEI